jgi:glycosyltransferase involved in cell wall biosynthesis
VGHTGVVSERVDSGAPVLSVVTPLLNGAAFIELCVRNVSEQNCEQAEHIVVDGGSTDGTLEILDRLVQEVPRLRLLARPGMCQSAAMNEGIQVGTGTIVGILNADDYYAPGTLNRVVEIFASFAEPTLLVGNCDLLREGQEPFVNRPANLNLESVLLGPRHFPFPFNPVAYFYDKEVHEIVGFYDEEDDFTMDVDFLFRALASVRSEYRDELWGHVRVHEQAKTVVSKASGRHRGRMREVLKKHRHRLPIARQITLRCKLLVLDAQLGVRLLRDPARLRRALRGA